MKIRFWALTLAVCGALQPFAVSAQASRQADFIVALVNSEPITNNDVRAAVQMASEQLTAQQQPIPSPEVLRQSVLERLINERAQLQIAIESGVRADDAAIDAAEQNIARQNQVDVATLRQRLAKEGVDAATFRTRLRDQLLLGRLREREVDSRVRVTDQDVDRYLSDLQAKNSDPLVQEINIAQILIAVPENATASQVAALQAQAQAVLQRARAGEDFATLVKQLSAAEQANGGQLGLRRGDRYPPVFMDAVQRVETGGIAEVIRSGAGFHILKVVDRRASPLPTRSVVQSRARHILLRTSPELTQAAAVARLASYRQRVAAGQADFAALAREFSQDGSAAQGGDLGWAGPATFVPEFEDAMNRLNPMEISPPLVSRFGVHLIQLLDRRKVDLSPREMREYVRNVLRETRIEEAFVTWARDIRGRAFVEMREPPV
jgi:peptidyl-prolyl cis-trans isomerase SurA